MLKPKKRWHIQELNANETEIISTKNGFHPLIAKILALRGLKKEDEVSRFLNPDLAFLHDPFKLDGMKKAVSRIQTAILKDEKILIYGDYDADGVTSTSLLYKTLAALKAKFTYYIPNRFTEGYGLNKEAIIQAANEGFKIIITVDTGISAIEEAEVAKELGITLIITDHHEPPAVLPDAYVVINPKKPGDTYPFKYLAGVGVAFKLAHALLGRIPVELIDIAAIGTIADMVPLVDENRIIVSAGLNQLKQTKHFGLDAILKDTNLSEKEISTTEVGFIIAPRINASGRLDTADNAVRLFISDQLTEVQDIIQQLNRINLERQALVDQVLKEALEIIEANNLSENKVLVIAKEDWNIGVIGIVASKILERYYRPTIILSIDSETKIAKGSARSIEGFDIYQALTSIKDILLHYGGHPAAAGLSIELKAISVLETELNQLALHWLTDDDFIPIEKIDTVCSLREIDLQFIRQIEQLAPFGIGNPIPKVLIEQSEVTEIMAMGKNKEHLKLNIRDHNNFLDVIAFKQGDLGKKIAYLSNVKLIGELSVNQWNGQIKPQIIAKDIRIDHLQIFDWRNSINKFINSQDIFKDSTVIFYSEIDKIDINSVSNNPTKLSYNKWEASQLEKMEDLVLFHLPPSIQVTKGILKALPKLERIYCVYGNNSKFNFRLNREMFKQVYLAIKENNSILNNPASFINLGISSETIQFILHVFLELGFIIKDGDQILLNANTEKKDLSQSTFYKEYFEQEKVKQLFLNSNIQDLKKWFLSSFYS